LDDFDLFDVDDAMEAAVLTQKSLVDTQDRLGVMLDIMPIGLLIHTEQGILFANQASCALLRTDRQALVWQHLLDFIRSSETDAIAAQFRASFQGGDEPLRGEAVVGRSDGPQRLVRLITGKLPWEGNAVIQVLLEDITDQRRAENSLRQQSITDELTGAYNRRHAFYEAALHVEASRMRGVPFSVAMFDIDRFKSINDTRGHAVGDIALKGLTALANERVPLIEGTDSAMFARLGGEEFVILLPGLAVDRAVAVAEDFRIAIETMVIDAPDGPLKFTVSAGVSTLADADRDFGTMLARADEALYEAKGAGRNQVMVGYPKA
jgi:diguanylate cyclase (GGDEF)-like protein/PAS domain S-box-containing protein